MIVHDCEQGSSEWHRLRAGVITASRINQIITPKTLKPSAATDYFHQIIAERLTGGPCATFDSDNMWAERGIELEPDARNEYAFTQGVEVREVGFLTTDDGRVGCSPDGLVGDDGGLEIKCPSAKVHVSYLLDPTRLTGAYWHQVQGSLFVSGRSWWDAFSHCPGLPPVLVRVEPSEEFQVALHAALAVFLGRVDEAVERIERLWLEDDGGARCPISGEPL